MWGKVSCIKKQHDGRDWASNHRPSGQKFNPLATKIKPDKNPGLNGAQNHDPAITGAVLYQLSYQPN